MLNRIVGQERRSLTSRRAPRHQFQEGGRTGPQQGPGSRGAVSDLSSKVKSTAATHGVGLDSNVASCSVLDQPSPSTSLDGCQSRVHLGLEVAERAVGLIDGLGQGTGGWLSTTGALGCQVLPEQTVVQVATSVEVDGPFESDLSGNVVLSLGLLELLDGVVVVGNIGLVMLRVVKLHDLTRDRGLQRTVVVWLQSAAVRHAERSGFV